MPRTTLVAFAVTAILSSGPLETSAQESPATATGTVVDSATGSPIANVVVYLDGRNLADSTNEAGEFALRGLSTGGHFAFFMKTGFGPDTVQFTVPYSWDDKIDVGVVALEPGPPPYATLAGTVVDAETRLPVTGASVVLNGMLGTITDSSGAFRVPTNQVQWGANSLEFERIGYDPMAAELWVAEQQTDLDLDVALIAVAVPLTEVVVEGRTSSVPARLAGFYTRREKGIGEFLTEEDWEDLPDFNVGQVLHRMHGVTVSNWRVLMANAPFNCRKHGISARIWVNGVSVAKEFIQNINIDDVAAIEVYRRIADIPIRYNSSADQPRAFGFNYTGSACGVVLIWTH